MSVALRVDAAPLLRLVGFDREKLLRTLGCQRGALVPIASLPALWNLSAVEAAARLAELVDAGDVEVWASEGSVILSATTAKAFRLVLDAPPDRPGKGTAGLGRLRWVKEAKPEKTATVVLSNVVDPKRPDEAKDADDFADPRAVNPLDMAERLEATTKSKRLASEYDPDTKRWILPGVKTLGLALMWPRALQTDRTECPACGAKKLPAWVVCLPCLDRDVYGKAQEGAALAPAYRPDPKLAGGKGGTKGKRVKAAKPRERKGYRHPRTKRTSNA